MSLPLKDIKCSKKLVVGGNYVEEVKQADSCAFYFLGFSNYSSIYAFMIIFYLFICEQHNK